MSGEALCSTLRYVKSGLYGAPYNNLSFDVANVLLDEAAT
jgi:hypothetical protein